MHCRWSCHFNLGLVVCLPTPVITGGKYSRESFGDHSYICRYYHNLVLDSFLIMFGHLVWALLSTALVFTLLGMVGVITLTIKFFLENHLKDHSWYKPRCTPTRLTRWPVSSPSSSMSPVKMSGLDSGRCSRRSIDVFHQNVKIFPRVSPLCPTLGYGPHFSSFSSSSPAWPLYWDVSGAEK